MKTEELKSVKYLNIFLRPRNGMDRKNGTRVSIFLPTNHRAWTMAPAAGSFYYRVGFTGYLVVVINFKFYL